MKILHVVTLVTHSGAFGGPLRVALNQARELGKRGHDVHVVAGFQGGGSLPREIDGVPVLLFPTSRLVPASGFSGLISPQMLAYLAANVATYDIVHVHAGRDLITQSAIMATRRAGVPYCTQTHGMVGIDRRRVTRLLDRLLVRRTLGGARAHLCLTSQEENELNQLLRASARPIRVLNGVPLPPTRRKQTKRREVLYCARLHPRKRPEAFVEMAVLLEERGVRATFAMVGPDEGWLAAVQARSRELGAADLVAYEGALPYEDVLQRLSAAAVYVLPSVDEPFPMSLLEALSLGVPSVCTDSCGIAASLREAGAAMVTDGSPQAMADAVQALLESPVNLHRQGEQGKAAVRRLYAVEAVVDQLESIYQQVRCQA